MIDNWYKSLPTFNNQLPRVFENFVNNEKFEDEEFPPCNDSLITDERHNDVLQNGDQEDIDFANTLKGIKVWKRISELEEFSRYELFPPELNIDNFTQGNIGDCYFISMIAIVSKYGDLITRLFPIPKNTYGYYEVILFINGWKRVIIDDQIPFVNNFQPLSCISKQKCFYNILLEKAWAKVNNMYYNIWGGLCYYSLTALTGFKAEFIPFNHIMDISEKYNILSKIYNGINIEGQLFGVDTHKHAYSLIDIKLNNINKKYYFVLKVRNPLGIIGEDLAKNLKRKNKQHIINEFFDYINGEYQIKKKVLKDLLILI